MARQHVENCDAHAVAAEPWTPAGLPAGATRRLLSDDAVTGAFTAIVDLPAGWDSSAALCCSAPLQLFVLRGRLRLGDALLKAGGYGFHPPESPQGRWRAETPVSMLVIAEAGVEFRTTSARQTAPGAIAALDSWALEWIDPLAASKPSVPFRTGLGVKLLRRDEASGSTTHLAGLLPGWYMPGMEVHPVYEENYCLSGDVHIAALAGGAGYTMTEGVYLCRPPAIAHGPIVSKNGNVNFCYTHGHFGIEYVAHPRSEELIAAYLTDAPWR